MYDIQKAGNGYHSRKGRVEAKKTQHVFLSSEHTNEIVTFPLPPPKWWEKGGKVPSAYHTYHTMPI